MGEHVAKHHKSSMDSCEIVMLLLPHVHTWNSALTETTQGRKLVSPLEASHRLRKRAGLPLTLQSNFRADLSSTNNSALPSFAISIAHCSPHSLVGDRSVGKRSEVTRLVTTQCFGSAHQI